MKKEILKEEKEEENKRFCFHFIKSEKKKNILL